MEKRERKEKKYTVYRERGKREREREKENVSHLVNLGNIVAILRSIVGPSKGWRGDEMEGGWIADNLIESLN